MTHSPEQIPGWAKEGGEGSEEAVPGIVAGSPASHGTGDAVSAVPASIPDALPEYGEWLPDVWDAYLRELVGWENVRHWARLPATFRWHEFHERLAQAIEARRAETAPQAPSSDESAVRQDAPEPGQEQE